MDLLTKDDLAALLTQSEAPCVSLFMPTHRVGEETRQDPIRFKNLLGQAEEQLIGLGLRSPEARELLEPAQALLDNSAFWRYMSDGLALFAAPETFRTFRLPLELRELVMVADRFRIKPLLPLFAGDGHFFVLALSQSLIRLLEATHYSVDEIDLKTVASGIDETLFDDIEKELQFQTSSSGRRGDRAALFHGHDPADDEKDRILRYFHKVDDGLRQVLRDEQSPLVLAGVDYLLPLYKEANNYPHVVDEGITGSPEEMSAEDLHQSAWSIVEPHFAQAQREAQAQYAQMAGTGLTSDRIEEVVPAAHHGRVSILWVALGAQVWGHFDAKAGSAHLHDEPERSSEDLLDLAALQTLLKGGTVYAVEPETVPGDALVAALFRY